MTINDNDFADGDDVDANPQFTAVQESLQQKNEYFMLTMNEKMYEGNDESDSENEDTKFVSELKRANTTTQTLFKGYGSDSYRESQVS